MTNRTELIEALGIVREAVFEAADWIGVDWVETLAVGLLNEEEYVVFSDGYLPDGTPVIGFDADIDED